MRLCALGDLHGALDDDDIAWLNAQDVDGVLICGDLGGPDGGVGIARRLASLRVPAVMIAGNHDAVTLPQHGAEMLGQRALADRFGASMPARVAALRDALGPVALGGWSTHAFGDGVVICGRPHSYGGPVMGFSGYLAAAWGVPDLDASGARLVAAVCRAPPGPRVVLAHNGPTGLGSTRDAPFGRDFHRAEGDWGDVDLSHALDAGGVHAVVAGHMHHRLSGGGQRRTFGVRAGVPVVNAAQVPRITRDGWRHHVELVVDGDTARVWTVRRRDRVVLRTVLTPNVSA